MKRLSKITESIWSDMQDRSMGKTVRKEDDIDLLDINELCEYLKTIYKTNSDSDISIIKIEDNMYLTICLYEDEYGYYRYIYYDGDYINTQLDVIETLKCLLEFERKFSIKFNENDFVVNCIDIYPKDKARIPVTNKFFIEVLDFILDRINAPLEQKIKKISNIKESIWSDMQDRSMGKTVREEDKITTNEDLRKKIEELYKEQGEGETLDVSSLTDIIKCDDFSNIFKGFYKVKHIIGLEDWDVSKVTNMKEMFMGCGKFSSDLSKWDVSSVEDMVAMFWGCNNFNSDLSKWNVSRVEDMDSMFWNCKTFNSDLSNWDVSSVTYMGDMFDGCENFNSDLSKWNVSKVLSTQEMFDDCVNFNSDLSNWDVSKVINMSFMFDGCKKFNSDLSKWNVRSVENMEYMFKDCDNFNSDLSKWNVSGDTEGMFDGCKSLKRIPSWYMNEDLNESIWSDMQDRSMGKTVREEDKITTNEELQKKIQELYKEQGKGEILDVSSLTNAIKCDDFSFIFGEFKEVKHIIGLEDWDVSNVKDMKCMFYNCINFNSDLSKWDVSNVEDMHNMFWNCKKFNSDLSKWDVSRVKDMHNMFWDCETFNSDLSKWNVRSVEDMYNMFCYCTNFNSDLSKWVVSNVKDIYGMFDECDSLKNIPSWYYTHS